jgi:hypothetical protein
LPGGGAAILFGAGALMGLFAFGESILGKMMGIGRASGPLCI